MKIQNLTSEAQAIHLHEFTPGEIYEIPTIDENSWANTDQVLLAISGGILGVHNHYGLISGINNQINYLKNKTPIEVKPTVPKNEFSMIPHGMTHKHIDASSKVVDITLSNGDINKRVFDFSCSVTPGYYDCIFQNDSELRDGVLSVDGNQLTLFNGATLDDGGAKLSIPVNIDYTFPVDGTRPFYMWGAFFSASDYGDDDIIRLQIVDTMGVGIALGYYTLEEFQYMGGEVVLKEYDECWIRHIDKIGKLLTPDGSPGELAPGLTLRAKYYCKDPSKTNIKVWIDYLMGDKDG